MLALLASAGKRRPWWNIALIKQQQTRRNNYETGISEDTAWSCDRSPVEPVLVLNHPVVVEPFPDAQPPLTQLCAMPSGPVCELYLQGPSCVALDQVDGVALRTAQKSSGMAICKQPQIHPPPVNEGNWKLWGKEVTRENKD
ncbi:hypothetical protein DUI87_08961 [Hirundo rustica rustica]|uniref:Uncharacterized protein n=1 Tax=Hirundo rustica rustica TaxID=333673 RepID=A0A3M0KKU9_HIRRU|nr:hypothetical protein DUI87_08961 [Hirundo rustica rustica]